MNKDWKKMIVAITGASSGIGEQIAYHVAKRGGTPILLARSYDKLVERKKWIHKHTGVEPFAYMLDVTDENNISTVFSKINKEVGQIDVLINNAGIGVFQLAHEIELQTVKNMFQVNVFGAIACTQAVLTEMMERKEGHIIFIASQAGKLATPKSGAYGATKHAILGYANSLRMEQRETGVHVSVVNPGPVNTPFFDTADQSGTYRKNVARYMLTPEKVAEHTVRLIEKPRREVNLPYWMGVGTKLYQLFPSLVETVAGEQLRKK